MELHRPARYALTVVALAAALIILSIAALRLQPGSYISLVYPATGLGAALLWGFGVRWWPAVVIAQFALSLRAGNPPLVASFVAATELLVILLFCAVVIRYRISRDLERLRDLGIFIAAVLLTPVVGGIVTVIGEIIFEPHPFTRLVDDGLAFWLSDFVSMLIFVPLLVGWRRWPFPTRIAFQRWLALAVLLMTLGAVIAERGEPASNTLFLLLPIVVFTALVAGIPGASASGAILLFILLGIGGMQHLDRNDAIIRVIFIGTATATGYVLAVIWREREQGALRLFHLAHHDSLTDMYNRHELETRLQKAVNAGPASAHALLYLDLDQFKLVNDTCGHMAGDRMLQELARELQRVLPRDATFARLGGDEFACILLHATEESALAVGAALHDATARYRFLFGSISFAVGVSIGITFFPAEGGDTADAVLGRADVACYVAKEDGRHRSHVYFPRDAVMLKWHSSIHEVAQFENAMENGGLRLYKQSIVDLEGGAPTKQGAPDAEIEMAIELAKAFESIDGDLPEGAVILSGSKSDFDRVFRVEVLGADGKPINTTGRTVSTRGESSVMTLQPSEPPPPNASLQIYLLSSRAFSNHSSLSKKATSLPASKTPISASRKSPTSTPPAKPNSSPRAPKKASRI